MGDQLSIKHVRSHIRWVCVRDRWGKKLVQPTNNQQILRDSKRRIWAAFLPLITTNFTNIRIITIAKITAVNVLIILIERRAAVKMFSGAQFSGRKKVQLASNHQDCSHLSLSDIRVILALLSTAFLLGVLSNLHHNHMSKFRFRISGYHNRSLHQISGISQLPFLFCPKLCAVLCFGVSKTWIEVKSVVGRVRERLVDKYLDNLEQPQHLY